MEILKYYFAKLLYLIDVIDLPNAIIMMLPVKDRSLLEQEIERLDNITDPSQFELTGEKKRKLVAEYLLETWLDSLDYQWLDAFFNALPNDSRKYLANAIVELIFFNLKKISV